MIDYEKPIYAIMCVLLIFIFLWFFFGGGEYSFIGLKPLDPNNIMDYQSLDEEVRYNKKPEPKVEEIKEVEDDDQLSMMENDICVNITPQIPECFTGKNIVHEPSNKFLSKGEKICRDTMEKIYGVPFNNSRPSWLKNHLTGRNMELDCYNEKLKLAVEYDGENHYKWPNYLNQSYEDFKKQARRDKLKVEICQQKGVHLIVVPYTVSFELIPTYIMYHLPEVVQQRLKNDQIL